MFYGKTKLRVSHEFSGFSDYWGGNGRRWDDDAGCLFAYYGAGTTLRECVDQWIDDFMVGGDCDDLPSNISENDLRTAILDSFTDAGRADYENHAIAECAVEYAEANDLNACRECGNEIGLEHEPGCSALDDSDDRDVHPEDCNSDEDCESPIWVILVEVEEYSILDNFDEWFACAVQNS